MDLSSTIEPYFISAIEFIGDLGPFYPSIFIGIVFFILLVFIWHERVSKIAPGILITLGIFFTFIGITIALFNFDPQNITQTIPELLEGLKLAFISSIVGLFLSIVYRIMTGVVGLLLSIVYKLIRMTGISKKSDEPDRLTEIDFYEQIKNINKSIQEGNKNIKEALIGEGEASLHTQIGGLRNDFRDFAQQVANTGTEALINALEAVIRDFNEQINEQFGDNFRQLNEAVEKLVVWQEQHRTQVEQLTQAFTEAQQGIQQVNESIAGIRDSIQKIPEHTSQIPEHMGALRQAFNATQQRMEELHDGLASLVAMKLSAENAIPAIKSHIDSIVLKLKEGAERQRQSIEQNLAGVEQLQENINRQIENNLTQITIAIQNQQRQVSDNITQAIDSTNTEMNTCMENIQNNIIDITNAIQNQQTEVGNNITQAINNASAEMQQYVQNLGHDTEEALQTMGNNLVPITEGLVEAYRRQQEIILRRVEELENQQ
ncbi:MAG: hypothetical protein GDA45_05225 [Chromatiales bacterium]|nr:hypothetical protein [Chromatiales bacterium]